MTNILGIHCSALIPCGMEVGVLPPAHADNSTHLPGSPRTNIEMRMCRPNGAGYTPFEIVELYVQ